MNRTRLDHFDSTSTADAMAALFAGPVRNAVPSVARMRALVMCSALVFASGACRTTPDEYPTHINDCIIEAKCALSDDPAQCERLCATNAAAPSTCKAWRCWGYCERQFWPRAGFDSPTECSDFLRRQCESQFKIGGYACD